MKTYQIQKGSGSEGGFVGWVSWGWGVRRRGKQVSSRGSDKVFMLSDHPAISQSPSEGS